MNMFAQNDDILRCVKFDFAGLIPTLGDLVVLERRSNDGSLAELSVRRITKTTPRFEFTLESNDPKWAGALMFKDGDKDDSTSIIGKVIWKYRKL